MSKQHSLDHILCISGHSEALKMPKAARGSAPSNPGLKRGHPPLKISCSIYYKTFDQLVNRMVVLKTGTRNIDRTSVSITGRERNDSTDQEHSNDQLPLLHVCCS